MIEKRLSMRLDELDELEDMRIMQNARQGMYRTSGFDKNYDDYDSYDDYKDYDDYDSYDDYKDYDEYDSYDDYKDYDDYDSYDDYKDYDYKKYDDYNYNVRFADKGEEIDFEFENYMEKRQKLKAQMEESTKEHREGIARKLIDATENVRLVKNELLNWIITIMLAIFVAVVAKNLIIINAVVPTGSMENTIMPGDNIIGNRMAYAFSEPKRGDIVIFRYPDDESQKFIKRVIGLPGDKIYINEGRIYINDSLMPLEEPYLKEEWTQMAGPLEYEVPEGCYFMMGDNRNNSSDSRYWKHTYVKRSEIIGKGEYVYFPLKHLGKMK